MKKLIYSFLVLCLALVPVVSYADEGMSMFATYNQSTRTVYISGTAGLQPNIVVSVTILESGRTPSNIDENHLPIAFKTIRTTDKGAYSYELPLPLNLKGGKYTIYLASTVGNSETTFMHINEAEVVAILPLINGATTQQALTTVLDTNLLALGIDSEKYTAYKDHISSVLFGTRPSSGYLTASQYFSIYNTGMATALFKAEAPSDVLKKYASYLGLDYAAEYATLPSNITQGLDILLVNADYTKETFKNVYNKKTALAYAEYSDRWSQLKEGILKLSTAVGIDISENSDYGRLSDKDLVFKIMYENSNMTSVEGIKASFNNAVATAGNSAVKGSGAGSSGGGGSSSGSLSVKLADNIEASIKFADLDGHWSKEAIDFLVQKKIVAGFSDGTFRPTLNVTRAEFVKLIVASMNIDSTTTVSFDDVKDNEWFATYIAKASGAGIAKGADGRFNPNGILTRQDAAVMIYRALQAKNINLSGAFQFDDDSLIAPYAKSSVGALASTGIIKGTLEGFSPANFTTRAEAAMMIYNTLNYMSK